MAPYVASPADIARALIAAENARDVDGVMALFAPDPTVRSAMDLMTTTDAVRRWQEVLAAGDPQIAMNDDLRVAGNVARWTGTIALDLFRKLGFTVLNGSWVITVDQGKITEFTFSLASDALAQVQAAMQKG